MSKGRVRHMFPGGNTSQGFFSYYDYILSQEEANKIICIKGGPGVGKSTFMKRIGNEMVERGYDVEFMHCSSDNNSLDGVVIPSLKIALLDGTAPHVVDPKNPGAVDEIIHLGDFWNEEGLKKHKEDILKENNEVGRTFRRAYRYIKSAYSIYEDNIEIVSRCVDNAKVNKLSDKLKNEILGGKDIADRTGRDRKLFASAITPNGLVNYLDTLINTNKVYVLKGLPGTGTEKVIQKIKEAAVERGYDVESFYCALNPNKLEHLIIPDLGVSITTSNEYHSANAKNQIEFNFDEYLDTSELEKYQDTVEFNKKNFEMLLHTAIRTIAKAKAIHDSLENYYIPNMDFEAVEKCYRSTFKRIFEQALLPD